VIAIPHVEGQVEGWPQLCFRGSQIPSHSVYVFHLPAGPVWALHTFYLIATALMLIWYVRYETRSRCDRHHDASNRTSAPPTARPCSEMQLPLDAGRDDLVAEDLVDLDHVRVRGGVPGIQHSQLRLLVGKPLQHRNLQQPAEAVTAVRS
jgi:hypothetical protein